jgi:2-(1,2-epoxy-1,2-dihydrophenyl)acetyl-CoA isomerase
MNDTSSGYQRIKLDVADGVAWITFNLPRFGNALDLAGVEEAVDALAQAEVRDEVGAVVLTGAGKQFCSGFNLREVPSPDDVRAVVHHFRVVAWWWHRLLEGLIRLPKPVLAAVNGAAAGSGLGMVLCSDLAVCKESARFLCAWHAIGIANDATTSYSLSKIVGFRRALELMLTNRTLEAREALEWGLVNRVFPDAEFDGQVSRIARELAEAPTHLQAFAKESFHRGWRMAVEETTAMEIRNVLRSLEDPAFADRLKAFLRHDAKSDRPIVDLS